MEGEREREGGRGGGGETKFIYYSNITLARNACIHLSNMVRHIHVHVQVHV